MKRLLILLLFIPQLAFGAVAFDANSTKYETNTTTTQTHTVTGANTLLLCAASGVNARSVTAFTFNGVSLTQVSRMVNTGNPASWIEMWRLIAPASGAHTVSVTVDAIERILLACTSFTGADQTTPLGSAITNETTSNSLSATITIPTNGMGYDAGHQAIAACGNQAPGGSQTERFDFCSTEADTSTFGSTITATGSQALAWTLSESNYGEQIAVPINAVGVATTRHRGPMILQ